MNPLPIQASQFFYGLHEPSSPGCLSDRSEFDVLCAIEGKLTRALREEFDAVFCGRITTAGRREFYFYAPRAETLVAVVGDTLIQFADYEFDCDRKADHEWSQYLKVLRPSEEDRQRIENHRGLEVLEKHADAIETPRDIWHWIYFQRESDRDEFRNAVLSMQYRIQSEDPHKGEFPFVPCIVEFQSVDSSDVDDAVIELYRLSRNHRGNYDGGETKVMT